MMIFGSLESTNQENKYEVIRKCSCGQFGILKWNNNDLYIDCKNTLHSKEDKNGK